MKTRRREQSKCNHFFLGGREQEPIRTGGEREKGEKGVLPTSLLSAAIPSPPVWGSLGVLECRKKICLRVWGRGDKPEKEK